MRSSTSTKRRVIAAVSAAAILAGCSVDGGDPPAADVPHQSGAPAPLSVSVVPVPPTVPAPGDAPPSAPSATGDLVADFNEIAATLPGGEVGVAIFDGQDVTSYGSWTTGAAWSTIKVPLSIAALGVNPTSAEPLMQRAITASDNAAADQMWNMLGDATTAAGAVNAVLQEGGDTAVSVQSQQVHPPYSPYGQTQWAQDQAAIFAFALPCIATAAPVLDQMHSLGGNQQWGLAPFADVAAKGGWGPEASDGGYLVRQIALVTNGSGTFGASLAAKPADGSFETGKAMLDVLGAWVERQRNDIRGGHC